MLRQILQDSYTLKPLFHHLAPKWKTKRESIEINTAQVFQSKRKFVQPVHDEAQTQVEVLTFQLQSDALQHLWQLGMHNL